MEFEAMKKVVVEAMENGAQWVAVTVKTRESPQEMVDKFERFLKASGWNVKFKANWWSPARYGVAVVEADKDGKSKTVMIKWVNSREDKVVRVEGKKESEGKREFYTIVDLVSDDFLYDNILRNMMNRY
ncbi:hypothetical protein PFDSM3638_04680 [Pyrococcus furiosus DSM 3638]|uniref:Uncharacterized protein n=3 Tax=Pyrococcus furiosus TaxID=2261 RepID=A0A5C0XUY9_PYRFU|nr:MULTISPECIES: hypothetical protein [Pyrococcus]AAL81058.1 hypothetical protein PF0934 [Pyrococcus furiosus DSM 3638]AFN03727.1 hypothetical protein PFC_03890 [Pyrococcus furiosus COM1]MDK2869725.1 hypothetical protein [Pyrococcus sp.]QEK78600.1 hypothetical protein PFDSM3638_04680 [Pyrococcus furiosus DSM 3638]